MKIFRKHKPVPFKFCVSFGAIKHNSSILFLTQALHTFIKRSPLKCKFLGFWSTWVKICQIPRVSFELTSQFVFKSCIILYSHDTNFPYKFWAHKCSFLDKRIPSKFQILDFQTCCGKNLLNSSCHFWKHWSVFLQMLHQFSVPSRKTPLYFFLLNHYILCSKETH